MFDARPVRSRLLYVAPALLVAVFQLHPAAQQAPERGQTAWTDDVLKTESYATPPKELAEAVLLPRHLNVSLTNISPDRKWFVEEIGDGPVLMKTLSKPFHELGGLFVDYRANRSRTLTIRNTAGLQIISASTEAKKTLQTPAGARISNATWSPDSRLVAYFAHFEDATHLWVTDVAENKAQQVTKSPVLGTLITTFEFSGDGRQITTVVVPDGRPAMPIAPSSPVGPVVKIADAEKNRLRTFPSLLTTPHQQALLEWHTTGQLVTIDLHTHTVRKVGAPAMIRSLDVSPDGKYVRVARVVKPFSYDVPVSNFGWVEEVWDAADGRVLAEVQTRPINVGVQDDPPDPAPSRADRDADNQQGRREIAWRADGQGLTFLEQEPAPAAAAQPSGRRGGRRGESASRPDRVMQWLPPFASDGLKVIYESSTRLSNHRFSPDMQTVFVAERTGDDTVEYAVNLSDTATRYTLARYNRDDVYANPGSIVMVRPGTTPAAGGRGGRGGSASAPGGIVLMSKDKESVFYQGTLNDRNPLQVGPKTFLDRVAIKTGEKRRLYESDNDNVYERIVAIVDAESAEVVLSREGPAQVPQNYLYKDGRRVQLTENRDLTPDLTRAVKQQFTVERPDGFRFKVKVTLPENYQSGTRLPAIFWFYPSEYTNQDEYDRPERTFNKNSFPTFGMRSMQFFVRLGYAVVEPDTPIVGPEGQMNNNYVNDLRNDLSATIDELDRRGLVDRSRLAIGGHSYGAFSAVNAMVHTPFFKAGIAGDGAYNRTLTPIGFQTERRDLWEARDVYLSMSPFLYANNLTGALLMYHNLADQNVGTDPTNSIRLYHALNGLGKTAALYLYPYEDHGPVAKETLLDLWARWGAWLEKYVKNPQKAPAEVKKVTTESERD
jgi:dipeptidyl aminopeptidase/acylaminoacyl peptidase